MPTLNVTMRSGEQRAVIAKSGTSLMVAIRDNGFDELEAACGGCRSCATCHVYVDADWLAQVVPLNQEEDDLLDSSDHRTPLSRLSCQIPFTEALEGLRVTIAPED